ncbi:hypothetical protein ILUMI_11428 [Ignelater luminosus]|uniref:DUF4371 domain-containing protein n=1 Tax=Ignelater luminosus TaxID=2038154 RepID=A0A8K0D511_IGNLU|nr:hypothetical protein ILUMI_11428 [Ignelater luminosus]
MQEFAFRGPDQLADSHNIGNYVELLSLLAQQDERLKHRLQTLTVFSEAITDTSFVAIIMDETRDISNKSQMSTVCRYITTDGEVQKRFLRLGNISGDRTAPRLAKHDDYDIKLDIFECPWYNKSYLKTVEASLGWYNRTERTVNLKLEPLLELKNNVFVDAQLYKFTSNEYRFFPVTVTLNACVEYSRNAFGLKDMLDKFSNLNLCKMVKKPYLLRNATLDASRFPPHMPRGSYKLVAQFLLHSIPYAEVNFYGRIVDKPLEWTKLPMSKGTY